MNALIETGIASSTRRATGSKFSINITPMEFSGYNCLYENPIYAFEIGFIAIYTYETFALRSKKYGHTIQQPVTTGIILEKGALKTSINRKLGFRASPEVADGLARDL